MAYQEDHPQLEKPLVQEALLEVRFAQPAATPYSLAPGRIYEGIRDTFGNLVELPTSKLPLDLVPEYIVRHRFETADGKRLVQSGQGVLSINHINYMGFGSFMVDCEKALRVASNIGLLEKVLRIGLRYINRAPIDRPVERILSSLPVTPMHIHQPIEAQSYQWIARYEDVGLLSLTIAFPVEPKPSLVLDIDHFREHNTGMMPVDLLSWVRAAHANVYECFSGALNPSYFAELSGKRL